MLRHELEKRGKKAKIGFSLHTPFPANEVYKMLPVESEILEGILHSDLVGFHTEGYTDNFIECCTQALYVTTQPL
jgi:trehalose 6-phosphate synthase